MSVAWTSPSPPPPCTPTHLAMSLSPPLPPGGLLRAISSASIGSGTVRSSRSSSHGRRYQSEGQDAADLWRGRPRDRDPGAARPRLSRRSRELELEDRHFWGLDGGVPIGTGECVRPPGIITPSRKPSRF